MIPFLLLTLLALGEEPDRDAIRARLWDRMDDFVSRGEGPGDGLPAAQRRDDFGFAKWADATVELGWWLLALAAEHHLRVLAGDDTEEVDLLLQEALAAAERVDRVAETGFPPPCTSSEDLNGFFVRDDVPKDHTARFPGLALLESDWTDPTVTNKEMSQDQVHHLALGLLAVETLVDDAVEVRGHALAPWAAAQGARILERLDAAGWTVTNPACDDRRVARGSTAVQSSPGFAGVYAALTDGGSLEHPLDGELAWETLRNPENPVYLNPDNLHMTLATAAAGNGYGEDTFAVVDALAQRDAWIAYPLVHVVLHGGGEGWSDRREALLAEADAMLLALGDAEPFGPAEGETAPHGWTSWHRFIRPAEQHGTGSASRAGYRFSGIDWLALDGLARLAGRHDDLDTGDVVHDDAPPREEGCGCSNAGTQGSGAAWMALSLGAASRRRRSAERPAHPGGTHPAVTRGHPADGDDDGLLAPIG